MLCIPAFVIENIIIVLFHACILSIPICFSKREYYRCYWPLVYLLVIISIIKHSLDQIHVRQRLLRLRTMLWIVVMIYNNILSYDGFTSTSVSAASSNNTMCDLLRLLLHFFTPPLSFLSEDHHDTIIIIIYLRQFNNVLA